MKPHALSLMLLLAFPALAADPGEEVELSSATVTALSCAQQAVGTGKLDLLTSCPMEETQKGLVVVDVAEMQIYRLAAKRVRLSDLERAFGGGSIDFTGVVKSVDKKDGIPLVEVSEFRITPKPKPGAFKGCL
ncbi:MAG: hypothetical protein IT380_22200 [Myxococcales bacterium]|nr:hypothetical protein [Myxococcales bacterium]